MINDKQVKHFNINAFCLNLLLIALSSIYQTKAIIKGIITIKKNNNIFIVVVSLILKFKIFNYIFNC